MIAVLSCIAIRHDPGLVALAALLCALGMITTVRLIRHAFATDGMVRAGWIFFAARVAGITIWTTHFISILAFHVGAPVSYDAALTILSLLIAVGGAGLGFAIATSRKRGPFPAMGGAVVGFTTAAMHYVGMLAYRVDGLVHWDTALLSVSILLAVALGALALMAARGQFGDRWSVVTPAVALFAMVVSLHFTGMSALEVVPLISERSAALTGNSFGLALATSVAALVIIGSGSFAYAMDRHARREVGERIAALARTDPLTGLMNRNAIDQVLRDRVRTTKDGDMLAAIVVEVMNIQAINQQFGARIGDIVVQGIASRLMGARRRGERIGRTAGAQFCGVSKVDDRNDAWTRTRDLLALCGRPFTIEGHEIPIDARVGGAVFPGDEREADLLMRKALAALARAASDPLQTAFLHDEAFNGVAQRQLTLMNDLRGAVSRREFELFYQPQVWISNRRVIGYEALVRWHHPVFGLVSPAEFIPLAEKTGCIITLGEWVLRAACEQAACWDGHCRVAVNVSPLQLRQVDLPRQIEQILFETGLDPERLEIEITESLLIDDRASVLQAIDRIKALGARLVLDDFGTGFSSIDVLRQFPFDKIKLDKTFVDDVEHNPQARAILHAMLELGRQLSIPILVEGVESARQLEILRAEGCRKVQGYLTGRPQTAEAIPIKHVAAAA